MKNIYTSAIALAAAIALPTLSCSLVPQTSESETSTTETAPETDYWQQALDQGYSAAVAASEAFGENTWRDVVQQWDIAISLLSQIPEDSPQYTDAQTKIAEYHANREAAKQNFLAAKGDTSPSNTADPLQEFKAELRGSEGIELLVDVDATQMTDEGVAVILTTQYPNLNSVQQEELITNLGRIWRAKAGDDAHLFAYVNSKLVGSATVHSGRAVVQVK